MATYEIIDHTADIGIRCEASSLPELFETAARGMFSIIVQLDGVRTTVTREIELSEQAVDDLLVSWLNELLYISEVESLLLVKFDIREIERTKLAAVVAGEPMDFDRHELNMEIKAVTYHELKVEQRGESWFAQVIFDI